MSFQKPLVTIELDEYNKMLEYIKLLDDSIGDSCNKYKMALQDIISGYRRMGAAMNYSISPSDTFQAIVTEAITKNNIRVKDNYEIE